MDQMNFLIVALGIINKDRLYDMTYDEFEARLDE